MSLVGASRPPFRRRFRGRVPIFRTRGLLDLAAASFRDRSRTRSPLFDPRFFDDRRDRITRERARQVNRFRQSRANVRLFPRRVGSGVSAADLAFFLRLGTGRIIRG